MNLLDLPGDCRCIIICATRTGGPKDAATLGALIVLCKDMYRFIQERLRAIQDHFTVRTQDRRRCLYSLCGWLHNHNGPAIIHYMVPDPSKSSRDEGWYVYGRCRSNNGIQVWSGSDWICRGIDLTRRPTESTDDRPSHTQPNKRSAVVDNSIQTIYILTCS